MSTGCHRLSFCPSHSCSGSASNTSLTRGHAANYEAHGAGTAVFVRDAIAVFAEENDG
jgi:hypothetical protein